MTLPLDGRPAPALSRRHQVQKGKSQMPLTGPTHEGRTFFCPHCGALYSVMNTRVSNKVETNVADTKIAKCVVCLHAMDEWPSFENRTYKLVHRPEDA
jgi:transcription elongation factor Elf1